MDGQLRLIEVTESRWRLDPKTIEIGRRGLAEARRALEATRRPASAA